MALTLKKGVKQLLEEATVRTRGMLEFWVDPESPYYKPVFTEGKTYVLYCAADWRAVLSAAVLADMGMENVLHLEGGFSEWKKAGRPVGQREHKHKG